jgi:hypothetical protein
MPLDHDLCGWCAQLAVGTVTLCRPDVSVPNTPLRLCADDMQAFSEGRARRGRLNDWSIVFDADAASVRGI